MTPIDSRLLFQLLREMCSEVSERTLEFLLMSKSNVVSCLLYGNNNTGEPYWPNTITWVQNAKDYIGRSEDEFRAAGISKLIRCCPLPNTEITSLEERIADLIDCVFFEFYNDDDIETIKQKICGRLSELDAPPKDIAYIESLSDYRDIADFLANRARNKGRPLGQKNKRKAKRAYKDVKKESCDCKPRLAYSIPLMIDTQRYIRRTDKVCELLALLQSGNKHIFVTAGGGVGKTSFIAEFCQSADNYEPHYTVFKGNVQSTIASLKFEENANSKQETQDTYHEKLDQLRRLDRNTVLIIDQFEGTEDNLFDEYYQDLETLQISIVFVTRSQFERPTVALDTFNESELLGLIQFYCGCDFVAYHREDLVHLILEGNRNTLFVDLLGRYFKRNRSGITPAQLLYSMQTGVLNDEIWNISTDSDYQERRKRTIPERLGILFNVSDLAEKECYILSAVSCYQDEGVSTLDFIKILQDNSVDCLNVIDDLITLGWLTEREVVPEYLADLDDEIVMAMKAQKHLRRLSVHPLVRTVIATNAYALCTESIPNWDKIKLYAYACLPSIGSAVAVPKLFGLIWDAIDRSTITKCEYIKFTEELADALCCGCENDNINLEARAAITYSYLHGFSSLDHDYPFYKDAISKIELLLNIWNKEVSTSTPVQNATESCPMQISEHFLRIWQAAYPHQIPTLRINPWNRKSAIAQECSDAALLHLQQLALHYSSESADVGKLINVHVALGLINQSRGVHEEAAFHFEQALALLSDNDQLEVRQVVAIYMNLAASRVELNDFSDALNVLGKAYRYITKHGDTYPCEQIFVFEKIMSLCWKKELYQEALLYLSEILQIPFSGVVDETHLLVDLTVATRNIAVGLKSAVTINFLDVLDKEIVSKLADAMVTYYQHYVNDMTENLVAQYFHQNNVPLDKQTLTKHLSLDASGQKWLQNTGFYRTGKASPDMQYKTWKLLKVEERFALQKEYVSAFLSQFVTMYEELFRTEIQKQLDVKDLSNYGFLLKPTKVTFGDVGFLNGDYCEYALKKETLRQHLLEQLDSKS